MRGGVDKRAIPDGDVEGASPLLTNRRAKRLQLRPSSTFLDRVDRQNLSQRLSRLRNHRHAQSAHRAHDYRVQKRYSVLDSVLQSTTAMTSAKQQQQH